MSDYTCNICGDSRPDAEISVRKVDISSEHGLRTGSVTLNVRFCNDRPDCEDGAFQATMLSDLK